MTLPPLSPSEFPEIFAAIHGGIEPFPWQRRLADELPEQGWPEALALPTGSGKTAAIDAALFHLALEADRGPQRRAPVRIAFVVDRRLIVDEAFERAERIRERLKEATGDGPLARMAARLRKLAGDGGPPLVVSRLRGGIPRENDWARTPAQPTVLCSTVDQVGSRLLFRGYGVSDGMRPVHAGLLGSDCLILLDEAHLAAPFVGTLGRVDALGRAERDEPRRWQVVRLSATPQPGCGEPFTLGQDDRADKVLAPRLSAAKPAALRRLPLSARDEPEAHAKAFADAALALLRDRLSGAGAVRPLAVVVNRVALARAVFDAVRAGIAADRALPQGTEAILLTGRIRDADRKALIEQHIGRLRSNGGDGGPPLIVVATQTIEAGADFDFDGLVTQIAPLDSLRQRFGRLNRMGRAGPRKAVVLAARDEVAAKADDAVYGDRARKTWDWLGTVAATPGGATTGKGRAAPADPVVDFGIDAMDARVADADVAGLSSEKPRAPLLRPADVELLSWTSPVPHVDPLLAPFLHGPKAGPADVQIVWRADITAETLGHAGNLLALVPPRAGEALAVPLWAAKAWLARSGAPAAEEVADLEGAPAPQAAGHAAGGRPAFRWAGPHGELAQARDLRPGDVIVVPADYGGCDEFGWKPADRSAVRDRGEGALRLHPALLDADEWRKVATLMDDGERSDAEWIGALVEAEVFSRDDGWTTVHRPEGYVGLVLTGRAAKGRAGAVPATEDDEAGTLIGRSVLLDRHGLDVRAKAEAFAAAAGLSDKRVADIGLAAWLHDEGKADARFQAWLRGGDRLLAAIEAGAPLAKSPRRMTTAASRAARRSAGLPDRWRHEAASVARAVADPRLAGANDQELVLWLIGVHHGQGRPLFLHDDPNEGPHRPDFQVMGRDWAELFTRLKARYGVWGLAWLEAVVRLADHRASEDEENAA